MDEYLSEPIPQKKIPVWWWIGFIGIDIILFGLLLFYWLAQPPHNYVGSSIEIKRGQSAADIADQLADANIVRSSTLLYSVLIFKHDPSQLKAGVYTFDDPDTVFEVANILANSVPQEQQTAVTFPEGFTHYEFNQFVPKSLAVTDLAAIEPFEGYLFPDTYYVPVSFDTADVIDLLRKTYEEKMISVRPLIDQSNLTESEVIIMASIIEREANDPVSMRLVSGILQNRLAIGMALQVDASVAYGLGISGTELTRADIDTDGPYNTYTRPGLPPAPISNPGLEAILAVLNPTPSDNFYYITGNDGHFYYAKTLEQHNTNIARYLR